MSAESNCLESLTVLIPVYNDGVCLEVTVDGLVEYLTQRRLAFEVIVVDDASTDETFQVVQRLYGRGLPGTFLRHDENRGPCSGLRTGRRVASGDWLLLLPADLAIPYSDISRLWEARNRGGVVLGFIGDSKSRRLGRRIQSFVYTALVNRLFGLSLRQINYVALYRTDLLRRMELRSTGVALHAEIIVRALEDGFHVHEMCLGHIPRRLGKERGANLRVVAKTLVEVLTLAFEMRLRSSQQR